MTTETRAAVVLQHGEHQKWKQQQKHINKMMDASILDSNKQQDDSGGIIFLKRTTQQSTAHNDSNNSTTQQPSTQHNDSNNTTYHLIPNSSSKKCNLIRLDALVMGLVGAK